MGIETTINIDKRTLAKVQYTAHKFGISKSLLISLVLRKMIRYSGKAILFKRVAYQKSDNNTVWHKLHVTFDEELYEKSLDLRKFRKMSVSYTVACGVRLYLGLIEHELQRNHIYNYDATYIFFQEALPVCDAYTIFWGMPGEKRLNRHINKNNS